MNLVHILIGLFLLNLVRLPYLNMKSRGLVHSYLSASSSRPRGDETGTEIDDSRAPY